MTTYYSFKIIGPNFSGISLVKYIYIFNPPRFLHDAESCLAGHILRLEEVPVDALNVPVRLRRLRADGLRDPVRVITEEGRDRTHQHLSVKHVSSHLPGFEQASRYVVPE